MVPQICRVLAVLNLGHVLAGKVNILYCPAILKPNGNESYVDIHFQTETGGHVITPLPGCTPAKPGSACFPFFGVVPVILDPESGKELEGACEGYIAFKQPWPGEGPVQTNISWFLT